MNSGPPMQDIMIPTGMSVGERMVLHTKCAETINSDPTAAEAGIR